MSVRLAAVSFDELYAQESGASPLVEVVERLGRVALPYPAFWLAALGSLGEPVDWTQPMPKDEGFA